MFADIIILYTAFIFSFLSHCQHLSSFPYTYFTIKLLNSIEKFCIFLNFFLEIIKILSVVCQIHILLLLFCFFLLHILQNISFYETIFYFIWIQQCYIYTKNMDFLFLFQLFYILLFLFMHHLFLLYFFTISFGQK